MYFSTFTNNKCSRIYSNYIEDLLRHISDPLVRGLYIEKLPIKSSFVSDVSSVASLYS